MPRRSTLVDRRVVFIAMVAMAIAVMSALIAQLLTALIGIVTKLAFHGRWSTTFVSPAENVGRVIVVDATSPQRMIGILTRGDLLGAHAQRLRGANDSGRHLRVRQAIGKTPHRGH